MRDVECKLLTTKIEQDNIGVEKEVVTETPIPIIKVEDIYANEYYEANQAGYQPTLRLRISALNYSEQKELIYMGVNYSIIRVSNPTLDEIVLICERKIADV